MPKSAVSGSLAIGCFGLFWSALTLVADGAVLYGIGGQLWAYGYSTAPGTVTQSSVLKVKGKGTSYRPDIHYVYSVNGQTYEGTQYRYSTMATPDNRAANIVQQHPVASAVTVYYNPRNPSDAVLLRGIEGMDLMALMFLTPFNAVMLGIWGMAFSAFRHSRVVGAFPGVRVRTEGTLTRARIVPISALVIAGATLGGAAFVATIIVVFLLKGLTQNLIGALVVW